eukprot:CAMPEP_0115740880 /NCGR_PEP_ID=MMETSP0272-20121206/89712_1 /TAXON_ID=71861 /ORGANISM="Scrippsiella trochoidea, Strain CCMP3099" /LENGTH=74 /DNA_ID=CAMNT_0003185529 /DNA_START=172 /DNA_END=396 /DNA_ORIENTATION=-
MGFVLNEAVYNRTHVLAEEGIAEISIRQAVQPIDEVAGIEACQHECWDVPADDVRKRLWMYRDHLALDNRQSGA